MNTSAFERAVTVLRAGNAVIFPTDTVYGLGVAVEHAPSPQAIYDLKHRHSDKPIAWLVGGAADLDRYGRDVPSEALALARRHWPGALTLVVNASAAVPRSFAPSATIGLRMPESEVALALIREVGPIAASSANRAGAPAPRHAAQVDPALAREAAFVLRDGRPASGIASTVVDATDGALLVLRQGAVALRV